MDSFRRRRSDKLKYLIRELENEIELLHRCAYKLMEKCLVLFEKMVNAEEADGYIAQYIPIYGYLSKCVYLISEFNCKAEIFLVTEDLAVDVDNVLKRGPSDIGCETGRRHQGLEAHSTENVWAKWTDNEISNVTKTHSLANNFDNDGIYVNNDDAKGIFSGKGSKESEFGIEKAVGNGEVPSMMAIANNNMNIKNQGHPPIQTVIATCTSQPIEPGYVNITCSGSTNDNIHSGVAVTTKLNMNNIADHVIYNGSDNLPRPAMRPNLMFPFPKPYTNDFYMPQNNYNLGPHPMLFGNDSGLNQCLPCPGHRSGPFQVGPQNVERQISPPNFYNAGIYQPSPARGWNPGTLNPPQVTQEEVSRTEMARYFQGRPLCAIPTEKGAPKYDLPPLNVDLRLGTVHHAILVHVVSPEEFYVHIKCSELAAVEEMQKKMKEYIAAKEHKNYRDYVNPWRKYHAQKLMALNTLGSYAIGYERERNIWTRVKILDWRFHSNDELIQVLHIDYGNCTLLPLSLIWPIDADIMKYPRFVKKCYLPFISPSGNELFNEWSEDDRTMFEIFVESAEDPFHVKMEIIECDSHRKGATGVRLILPGSEVCINDKLVECGIAVLHESKKEDRKGQDNERGELECSGRKVGNEGEASSVCASLKGRESAAKGSFDDVGTYMPPFSVGERVPVRVTYLSRINRFFCVKDYEKLKETDVLQSLISHLNNKASVSEMVVLDGAPKAGELVLGKYVEDNLWYRAMVVKSEPASKCCKLLFLDYGNTQKVSVKEMRKMESKYLKFPFQMLECHLENVELGSCVEPQTAITYFYKKIEEGDITIVIRSVVDALKSVYNVNIYDKQGRNIVSDLVDLKYAILSKSK